MHERLCHDRINDKLNGSICCGLENFRVTSKGATFILHHQQKGWVSKEVKNYKKNS